jgi:hypothetical protein
MKVRKCLYRKRRNFCWRNAGCSCRNKKQRAANGADSTDIAQEISDADALIGSLVVPPVGDGFLAPGATSTLVQALTKPSGFPPRAQQNALRRRDVRLQSRLFARWNQRLTGIEQVHGCLSSQSF